MYSNRNKPIRRHILLFSFAWCLAAFAPASSAADLFSYTMVQDDGTLKIKGKIVHLFGVYVPDTGRTCRTNVRPVRCTSRAAHALEFKIGPRFVRCEPTAQNPDGSLVARCYLEEQDLSAYLLERGWAVATPDAPFAYTAMERIARSRGVGVWGIALGEP